MELSKLNINSIAKEEIRRKFFDSRSLKNNKANNGQADEPAIVSSMTDDVKEESIGLKKEILQLDKESVEEEDGFPLITSVFSLASTCNESNKDLSCAGDNICEFQCMNQTLAASESNMNISTNQDSINASLPVPTTGSNINVVTFIDATKETTIPVSRNEVGKTEDAGNIVEDSCGEKCYDSGINEVITDPNQGLTQLPPDLPTAVCETKLSASNAIVACADNLNDGSSTGDVACVTQKTLSLSVLEENSNSVSECDDDAYAVCSTDDNVCAVDCDENDEIIPTRQETKIRQLKDLLRKKEEELEKFRFNNTAGSATVVAKLRANFVKKNPSLCRKSPRLKAVKKTELGTVAPSNNESAPVEQCDSNEQTRPKDVNKSPKDLSSSKESQNDDRSNTNAIQASAKFSDRQKYRLVDVKVLQGHTRTLAVPLKSSITTDSSPENKAQNICRNRKQNVIKDRCGKQRKNIKVEQDKNGRHSNGTKKCNINTVDKNNDVVRSSPRRGKLEMDSLKRKSPSTIKSSKVPKTCATAQDENSRSLDTQSQTKSPVITNTSLATTKPLKNRINSIKLVTDMGRNMSDSGVSNRNEDALPSATHELGSNQLFAFVVGKQFELPSVSSAEDTKSSKNVDSNKNLMSSTIRIPVASLEDKAIRQELGKLHVLDNTGNPPSGSSPAVEATQTTNSCSQVLKNTPGNDKLANPMSLSHQNTVALTKDSTGTAVSRRNLAPKPLVLTAITSYNHRDLSSTRLILPKPARPLSTSQKISNPYKPVTAVPITSTTPLSCLSLPLSTASTTSGTTHSQSFSNAKTIVMNGTETSNITTQSGVVTPALILPQHVVTGSAVASSSSLNNLNNGRIIVYNFASPKTAKEAARNLGIASNDTGKLLVHVSNTGHMRNLGIMIDNKVYLYNNQVSESPTDAKSIAQVNSSDTEFIPNPDDVDFRVLLGLEHIVQELC